MAAVSSLEIMALAMSADGFVPSIMSEWDRFKRIATEHAGGNSRLAQELSLFTDPDARAELEFDLQFSQTAIRTNGQSTLPAKLQVAAEFKKAFDTLNVIAAAIEAIKGNHTATYGAFPAQPALRVLKSHVAVFEEACARFHQRLMPIRAYTPAAAPLVPDNLQFECASFDADEKPAIEQIGETCFQQKVVYTPPGATKKVTKKVLIEKRPYTTDKTRDSLLKEAREVAKKLGLARKAWNIPELIGYRDEPVAKAIELVFKRPNSSKPATSLWDCYAVGGGNPQPLLNIRVHLCRQLANAVAQAHRIGLIHGDIRPRNVVVTYDQSPLKEMLSGSLYLVGWSNLGHTDNTVLAPDALSESEEMAVPKMVYQHPNQWATTSAENKKAYDMGNDIYSLGVCMIEILLWEPLFSGGSPSSLFEALYYILGHRPGPSTSVTPVAPVVSMLKLIESVKASMEKKKTTDDEEMDEKTRVEQYVKEGDTTDEKEAMASAMRNYSFDDSDIEEIKRNLGKSLTERYLETPAGVKHTIEQMAYVYVAKKAGDRMSRMVFRCLTGPPYFSNEQNPNQGSLGQTNRLVQAFYDDMFDDFNMVLAAL